MAKFSDLYDAYLLPDIMGMEFQQAQTLIESYGGSLRRYRVDGQPMIVTSDYRLDRLNVEIADGKIIGIKGLG